MERGDGPGGHDTKASLAVGQCGRRHEAWCRDQRFRRMKARDVKAATQRDREGLKKWASEVSQRHSGSMVDSSDCWLDALIDAVWNTQGGGQRGERQSGWRPGLTWCRLVHSRSPPTPGSAQKTNRFVTRSRTPRSRHDRPHYRNDLVPRTF
jgi:hypothetical protein